jgi:hypothetical protein
MRLIVRYGPAPGDTAAADGTLHASFSGFFLLSVSTEEAAAMLGRDGSGAGAPDAPGLVRLAAAAWLHVTAEGHGHMLIGAYSELEYVTSSASCGFTLGRSEAGVPFAPKDYVPLYAVARAAPPDDRPENGPAHIDLSIDYRGTAGPGDPSVRPEIFVACGEGADVDVAGGRG